MLASTAGKTHLLTKLITLNIGKKQLPGKYTVTVYLIFGSLDLATPPFDVHAQLMVL